MRLKQCAASWASVPSMWFTPTTQSTGQRCCHPSLLTSARRWVAMNVRTLHRGMTWSACGSSIERRHHTALFVLLLTSGCCANAALMTMPVCAQDHGQLYGGMLMLRLLTRKYEFKDESEREPLAQIVSVAFPPLLAIFQVPQHQAHAPEQYAVCSSTGFGALPKVPGHICKCSTCCRVCWRVGLCLQRQHSF